LHASEWRSGLQRWDALRSSDFAAAVRRQRIHHVRSRRSFVVSRSETTMSSMRTGCLPSGPSCQSQDNRCDGEVAVACVVGEEERIDCAQIGGRCIAGNCNVTDCGIGDACVSGTLTTCVDGVPASIDCAAIGLSMCAMTSDGRPSCG
jgi:hypothetical protein